MNDPWSDLMRVVRWSLTTVGAAALLAAGCEHAYGATLGTWTGPGDSACAGRCSEEWARTQLPEARRAELERAGEPVEIVIRDGAVLSLMTYWRGGPVAQHGAVAVLDAPEPATCRVMDGWSWCIVHGCQNWAAVEHAPTLTTNSRNGASPAIARLDGVWTGFATPYLPRLQARYPGGGSVETPGINQPPWHAGPIWDIGPLWPQPQEPRGPFHGEPPSHPAPVPLPAAAWLLLAGIAALLGLRR